MPGDNGLDDYVTVNIDKGMSRGLIRLIALADDMGIKTRLSDYENDGIDRFCEMMVVEIGNQKLGDLHT